MNIVYIVVVEILPNVKCPIVDNELRTATRKDFDYDTRGTPMKLSKAIFWTAYLEIFFNKKAEIVEYHNINMWLYYTQRLSALEFQRANEVIHDDKKST